MRVRRLSRLAAAAVAVAVAITASAAASTTKRARQTFVVAATKTRTLIVGLPDALKFQGSHYSGTVTVLPPPHGAHGARPQLSKLRILSKGLAEGGSVYRVRVRNDNPRGTAAIRVRVTAITVEP